jgi:hypothetical protein
MLIRSTQHACFVILRNGLTLELAFDFGGQPNTEWGTWDALGDTPEPKPRPAPRSQGVWMLREEVLFEVNVGQA